MEDKTKILYDKLSEKGLYTKSYEEFTTKYSDPEARVKMHSVLSEKGLYTKSIDEFNNQYFPTVKKKESTEIPVAPTSNDLPKDSTTALVGELPLVSQEQPKPEVAETLWEKVFAATGATDKAFAKVFDELDYVQTTAGDAVTQVLLGKDVANKAAELRKQGVEVNPINNVRPFKAVSDALEWTASGTKEIPNTIGGQITRGFTDITPDVVTTMFMPEIKGAQWMDKLGVKVSKFGTVMGARAGIESAESNETGTTAQKITAPMLAATEGYLTGYLFDNMGEFAQRIGFNLTNKLLPASNALTKQLSTQTAATTANAIIVGGYGTGQELLDNGINNGDWTTSSNTFLVNAGMGIGMGLPGMSKTLFAKGVNSFMATPNKDVVRISKSEVPSEELINKGIEKANEIDNKTSTNPETDLAAAALNINTGINKAFVEEIKANPEGVKKDINDSNLDPKVKESIVDKIDDLTAMENPLVQKAKPFTEKITEIDSQIESIKNNKSLSSVEKEIQTAKLNEQRDALKIEVENVYNVKPKSKEDGKEVQAQETEVGTEKPTVESPVETEVKAGDVIPTDGKKGSLKKTDTGYEVTESIFGSGETANHIKIDKVDDVVLAKDRINKLESETNSELDARNIASQSESPYRIGAETFETKKDFIKALKKMVSGKSVDAMFVMEDIKFAKDVTNKEVMDIVDKNALVGGMSSVDLKLTSTSELMGIKDEVIPRVKNRIDKASELINKDYGKRDNVSSTGSESQGIQEGESTVQQVRDGSGTENVQGGGERGRDGNGGLEPNKTSQEAEISTISSETGKDATQGKEVTNEPVLDSYKTLAARVSSDSVISVGAIELTSRFKKLQADLELAKSEPKRVRQLIDGFLKENSKALNDANIKASDLKLLNKASTWDKARPALIKLTERINETTNKQRQAEIDQFLKDKGYKPKLVKSGSTDYDNVMYFISKNRDVFKGLKDRVYQKMLRLASEGYQSDAKKNKAIEYIDKILTNQEAAKNENERLKIVDDINKMTSDSKLLEKGGKNPRVKTSLMSRDGNTDRIEAVREINDLINEGKSKRFPDPQKKISENLDEIQKLTEVADKISKEDLDRLLSLQAENEILKFSDIDNMTIEDAAFAREQYKEILTNMRTKASIERADRHAKYREQSDIIVKNVIGEIKKKKGKLTWGREQSKSTQEERTSLIKVWRDASWFSMNSMLAEKGNFKNGELPIYNDPINEIFAERLLKQEGFKEFQHATLLKDMFSAMDRIFKTTNERNRKRKMMDTHKIVKTGIDIIDKNGEPVELELNPMMAANLVLQWRDPYLRKSMVKEYDSKLDKLDKNQGMGFTEQTIKELESLAGKEVMEYAEWANAKIKEFSYIYDEAYKRANGISFKSDPDAFYHPGQKIKMGKTEAKDVNEIVSMAPTPKSDRTNRRTGDDSPLEPRSVHQTMMEYANEAIHYSAFNDLVRDIRYVYNDPMVKDAIIRTHGTRAMDAVNFFINDFAGKNNADANAWIDRSMFKLAPGLILGKFKPGIKQMSASVYYALGMPVHRMLKSPWSNIVKRNNEVNKLSRELLKSDPFYMSRTLSTRMGYDVNMEIAETQKSTGGKLRRASTYVPTEEIRDVAGIPLREGDKIPIISMGSEFMKYRYEIYEGKPITADVLKEGLNGNMSESLSKAMRDWEMISTLTQQTTRASNRSMFRATPLGRAATVFTSQPAQIHRLSFTYIREFNRASRMGDSAGMTSAMTKFLITWPLSGVLNAVIDANLSVADDEDASDVAKRFMVVVMMGNLSGLAYVGRMAEWAKGLLLEDYWAKADKIQIAPILSNVEKMGKNADDLRKELSNPVVDWGKVEDSAGKLSLTTSNFLGIPTDSFLKLGKGALDVTEKSKEWYAMSPAERAKVKEEDPNDPRILSPRDAWEFFGMKEEPVAEGSKLFQWKGKMTYEKAVSEVNGAMKFDSDGAFVVDFDAVNEAIEKATNNNLPTSSIVAKAYAQEVRDKMKRKYGDVKTSNDIIKAFDNPDITPAEVERLLTQLEKTISNDQVENYQKGMDAVIKIIQEKAVEETGQAPIVK